MTSASPTVSYASDAIAHFIAGIFFSLLDYITSKLSNRKADRLEALKECLVSIDALLGPEPAEGQPPAAAIDPTSIQYALNVHTVKEYFIRSGIIKENVPLAEKIGGFFRNEKLNNLTFLQKVYVTLGIESLDTFIGMGYYAAYMHASPVVSFVFNFYQMPLFLAGLYVGKYLIRNPIEWITTGGEERKMRKAIENAAKNTPVVGLVLTYKPPEQVANDLSAQGKRFTGAMLTARGKNLYRKIQIVASSVGDTAKKVTESVTGYAQQQSQKAAQEKQAAKDKFNDLTKGR
jgi:hypothetical protein